MPATTQKFTRLPPRTGIPFEGFEFARVKSRTPVALQLEAFLDQCAQSNSVNVALIRAEWGEGKTDAYERYIEPKIATSGSFGYLVSTSTIALHLEKIKETFPRGGTTAASFLATVFAALKDELRSRHLDAANVVDYRGHSDPLEYVHAVLRKHLENTDGKLFLFIDEFEEILNHPDEIQRFTLSGIKELINGQLGIVHSGGAFGGRFHLIVAVTPYAYGRMHDDRELLQIFGSFVSRPSTIDLPPIGRDEAFDFLVDLVRYSYEGSLPEPLPFKSAGVLNAIAAISQKNMRALVQLYVDTMTGAIQKDGVRIVDADRLIDALTNKELAVYGELRPCIDGELLARIEAALRSDRVRGQHCVALFRLLVGEYKPFNVEEVRTRLGLSGDTNVHALVDIVNQGLTKLGIPRAIMRLNPPRRNVSPASVLNQIAPGGGDILLVQNQVPVQSFEDALVHMEFGKDGGFEDTIYLPYDEVDLKDLFDIGESDTSFLQNKIGQHFEEAARNRHFIISRQLAEQMFPSPTWSLIDFITERSKRAELWREAAKTFGQRLWQLRDLVIEVINCSSRVGIKPIGKAQAIYETQYNLGASRTTPIRTHIMATTSVTETDVSEAIKAMGSKGANMGILIHTGDIDDQARRLIAVNPHLMTVHIRRVRMLQLLVLGLAREKNFEVRESVLDARLRDIFHEFDFERLLDQWVRRLREEGFLIDGLTTRYGRSDKALADALAFSTNHLGESLSPRELFDRIAELRSFTIYRQNTPFAPIDVETVEELENYMEDMVANGFLRKEQNKFSVVQTRVEERIVKSLDRRPLSPEVLRRHFIIFSPNDAILEQVYIPTLERKGLVSVGDEIALQDPKVALRSTKEAFQKYDARVSALRQTHWWSYALLCVSKEREDRVISIEDFDAYVHRLCGSLQEEETVRSQPLLLQRCHLTSTLLAHYDENLEKKVSAALSNGESHLNKATEMLGGVVGKASLLVQEYNTYCEGRTYTTGDVEELTALDKLKDRMTTIDKTTFSKDMVITELQTLRRRLGRREKPHFFFGHEPEKADYYSLKVKQLRELSERFQTEAESAVAIVDQIEKRIRDVQNARTRARGRLATYHIDKAHAVASEFLTKISELHAVPLKAAPSTSLTVSMLRQFFDRVHETLAEFSGKINQGLDTLDEILEYEKSVGTSLGNLEKRAASLAAFFDLEDDPSSEANRLMKSVAKIKNSSTDQIRVSLAAMESVKDMDQLIDFGRKVLRSLEDIHRKFSPIEGDFATLKTECKASVDEYYVNASKLIDVLNAAGPPVSAMLQALKTIISTAKGTIDKVFESEPAKFTWSKIWEDLDAFRDQLYRQSKKIISTLEFRVLYSVVSSGEKGAWLVVEQVVRAICKQQKLEKSKVEQAVKALIRKRFLKEGVSLAI